VRIETLGFRHSANPTERKHLPETMGSGVAVVDIDRDGRLDLFFVNGAEPSKSGEIPAKCRLYRNLGNWSFEDLTDRWRVGSVRFGMGVAVGDYDNDGLPDLYITASDRNYLYRNTGSAFVDVTERAHVASSGWSSGAAFVDFDRDGRLDLFVARYLDWSFANSRWCGEGEGTPRAYCHPREFGRVTHTLFRNLGNGSFEDVSTRTGIDRKPSKGLGVRIEDANADGWPDILVANDSVPQQLFLNRSGKSFDESALRSGLAYDENGNTYAGMGIDVADADGDGLPEVIINALARQGYWLYKNDGEGRFSDASASSGLSRITDMRSGWGMRFADFDNDGWSDLVVAQGHVMDTIEWSDPGVRYLEPPLLAKNVFGKFFDVSKEAGAAFSTPAAGRGLATGDLDGDGLIDVVINNNNAAPTLLRNATKSSNNWLAVRLQGSRSNRDGYGSEVIVTTDSGRRLRAYSDTSGSYLSASSPVLHFGLGPAGKARQIEVTWPRGARSVWRGAASNRGIRLREPNSEN
jgi:enediyne biosynthesis protein E4